MGKIRVGILGATGTVGQRFVAMLEEHPQFVVTALAASDRSQGRPYGDACTWRLPGDIPTPVRSLGVQPPRPPLDCDVVFSSLAAAGAGLIVTNPNCSTVMLALALAPLAARFGVEAVAATTLQAVSGAGYPGVASLDITDNVIPYIANEEEKIERETLKILGRLNGDRIAPAPFAVSAQCHRVNVVDGHMAAVRVKLSRPAGLAELREAFAGFTGEPQRLGLHTAPVRPILVRDEPDRPQPRLDRDAGRGMSVTVGRIASEPVLGHRFVVLSHNTIRGAAGAAILNAELLRSEERRVGKECRSGW